MFSATNLNCARPRNSLKYNKPDFRNWSETAVKSSNPCKLASTIQTGLQLYFDNHVCLDGIFEHEAQTWSRLLFFPQRLALERTCWIRSNFQKNVKRFYFYCLRVFELSGNKIVKNATSRAAFLIFYCCLKLFWQKRDGQVAKHHFSKVKLEEKRKWRR